MSLSPILTSAAFAPIQNVGWIRITGSDRVRWLNGMVTNNIAALQPGEGCYNFFLNAQGRIQGDATAWMLEDSILLETSRAGRVATMLDHFIIMDDVELQVLHLSLEEELLPHDRSGPLSDRFGLFLNGPKASDFLTELRLPFAPELSIASANWQSVNVDVIHTYSPIVPRFEVWSDAATVGLLAESLKSAGATEATPEALEQLRILSGTPLYGTDIRDKDLPQETAQTRALHFTKGCYLGQEIVERIRSRGNVHRTFSGFILTGELPTPGTILSDQAKPAGELTSVTRIELPSGPMQLALGYIRREALESAKARGTPITYPGGTATPAALPFQLPESRA